MKTQKIFSSTANSRFLIIAAATVFMCMVFTSGVYGQKESSTKTEVPPPPPPPPPPSDNNTFQKVDKMPAFPGGEVALMKFIGDSIRYPKDAKEKGLQGKVITSFIVKADGTVSEVKIIRGISRSLDDEALRVIKSLPDFIPAELDGKKVAVSYMIPINFALN